MALSITDIAVHLEERLCARLVDQIRPILRGRPSTAQGLVLLQLVAEWIVQMPPDIAADRLDLWLTWLPKQVERVRNGVSK